MVVFLHHVSPRLAVRVVLCEISPFPGLHLTTLFSDSLKKIYIGEFVRMGCVVNAENAAIPSESHKKKFWQTFRSVEQLDYR